MDHCRVLVQQVLEPVVVAQQVSRCKRRSIQWLVSRWINSLVVEPMTWGNKFFDIPDVCLLLFWSPSANKKFAVELELEICLRLLRQWMRNFSKWESRLPGGVTDVCWQQFVLHALRSETPGTVPPGGHQFRPEAPRVNTTTVVVSVSSCKVWK